MQANNNNKKKSKNLLWESTNFSHNSDGGISQTIMKAAVPQDIVNNVSQSDLCMFGHFKLNPKSQAIAKRTKDTRKNSRRNLVIADSHQDEAATPPSGPSDFPSVEDNQKKIPRTSISINSLLHDKNIAPEKDISFPTFKWQK